MIIMSDLYKTQFICQLEGQIFFKAKSSLKKNQHLDKYLDIFIDKLKSSPVGQILSNYVPIFWPNIIAIFGVVLSPLLVGLIFCLFWAKFLMIIKPFGPILSNHDKIFVLFGQTLWIF